MILPDFDKFIPKSESHDSDYVKNRKRESILSTDIAETGNKTDEALERPNPFKIEEKSQFENLEYALQILEDLTSRLNTSKIDTLIRYKNKNFVFFSSYIYLSPFQCS